MSDRVREELVQVAAVAISIIEDIDTGTGADRTQLAQVMGEVANERLAQNRKWGAQHHPLPYWLAILVEEVGEAAQAIVEAPLEVSDDE